MAATDSPVVLPPRGSLLHGVTVGTVVLFVLLVWMSVGGSEDAHDQAPHIMLVRSTNEEPFAASPTPQLRSTLTPTNAAAEASPSTGSIDCRSLGTVAPTVHYKQYFSHSLGDVPIANLREAARDIARAAASEYAVRHGITCFIQDGTLLSALRWGRIVNDNDVEFGFVVSGVANSNVTGNYFEVLRLLVAQGIIDEPTPRVAKKMWANTGLPKPGRCQMRPQLMQCRHHNGVMMDIFGPWVIFAKATGQSLESVLPPSRCRMFEFEMPCPKNAVAALKSFTLEHETGSAGKKQTWFEFRDCPLLPIRHQERDRVHLEDILKSSRALAACGFPSLYEDRLDPSCLPIFGAAGMAQTDIK